MTQFKTQKFTFFAPRTVIFYKNLQISMIFHILQQFTNIFINKCSNSGFYDLHTYNIFAEIYKRPEHQLTKLRVNESNTKLV